LFVCLFVCLFFVFLDILISFMNFKSRSKMFQTVPQDRPLVVQFCGNEPDLIVAAAKLVEVRSIIMEMITPNPNRTKLARFEITERIE
jgi:hypothetical protein